jgi:hypothetical protein
MIRARRRRRGRRDGRLRIELSSGLIGARTRATGTGTVAIGDCSIASGQAGFGASNVGVGPSQVESAGKLNQTERRVKSDGKSADGCGY